MFPHPARHVNARQRGYTHGRSEVSEWFNVGGRSARAMATEIVSSVKCCRFNLQHWRDWSVSIHKLIWKTSPYLNITRLERVLSRHLGSSQVDATGFRALIFQWVFVFGFFGDWDKKPQIRGKSASTPINDRLGGTGQRRDPGARWQLVDALQMEDGGIIWMSRLVCELWMRCCQSSATAK